MVTRLDEGFRYTVSPLGAIPNFYYVEINYVKRLRRLALQERILILLDFCEEI